MLVQASKVPYGLRKAFQDNVLSEALPRLLTGENKLGWRRKAGRRSFREGHPEDRAEEQLDMAHLSFYKAL